MTKGPFFLLGLIIAVLATGLAYMLTLGDSAKVPASAGATASRDSASAGPVGGPHSGVSNGTLPSLPAEPADPALSQGYGPRPAVSKNGDANPSHSLFTAYRMEPIKLNLNSGPFVKQTDGTVLKTDTSAQAVQLNQADSSPEDDLNILGTLVDHYRRIFGANPIAGDNRDLVLALTGDNPHKLVFIDPGNPAINPEGELIDRWGTPFRFHPVSSQEPMEIFSAGPDAAFGTADDVMLDTPIEIGLDDSPPGL